MFNSFQRHLAERIYNEAKIWGVHFESKNPPEFIVTKHAEIRLKERLNVAKESAESVVIKAWLVGLKIKPSWFREKDIDVAIFPNGAKKKFEYRTHKDRLFIFAIVYNPHYSCSQKHLITVITKPNK